AIVLAQYSKRIIQKCGSLDCLRALEHSPPGLDLRMRSLGNCHSTARQDERKRRVDRDWGRSGANSNSKDARNLTVSTMILTSASRREEFDEMIVDAAGRFNLQGVTGRERLGVDEVTRES